MLKNSKKKIKFLQGSKASIALKLILQKYLENNNYYCYSCILFYNYSAKGNETIKEFEKTLYRKVFSFDIINDYIL